MIELKPLTRDAIPRALEKAERYRLLNEPAEAESICEDVLRIDPDNPQALVTQLLAVTDQFDDEGGGHAARAHDVLSRIHGEYESAYYAGIVAERHAKARLRSGGAGATLAAAAELREAMRSFEQAEAVRPSGNDDALLRWNACARLLMRYPVEQTVEDRFEPLLE